jgi:hypothetical protein
MIADYGRRPMERIKTPLTREYLPIKLYLGDLVEIERILADAKGFNFTTGNIKCDSVGDLVENCKSRRTRR